MKGTAVLGLLLAFSVHAQECKVLDPELQGAYSGPCVNGLAEGFGAAAGTAEYRGELKAGRKHGKGVKSWANGDRYEGEFAEDRKHGEGFYTWGRGPWAGERYQGSYRDDQRHGHGTYRWNTGDVYTGPWENDAAVGQPTPMMLARMKFEEEAKAAVAHNGQRVCREMKVGIAERDWIRGTVVAVVPQGIGVRIEDPGSQVHIVNTIEAKKGEVVWDTATAWVPCFP